MWSYHLILKGISIIYDDFMLQPLSLQIFKVFHAYYVKEHMG